MDPKKMLGLCLCLGLVACVGASAEEGAPDPRDESVPALPAATERLQIDAIDKIDVLFVVDSSASMKEEQQALGEQLPNVARALATGDIDADGTAEFPPPRDVHFGVISPDLGLPGIAGIDKCDGAGDD